MSADLARPEDDLAHYERIIETGQRVVLAAAIQTGEALQAIRDQRLYRLAGHVTFTDYTEQRWDMRGQAADRLIRVAVTHACLIEAGLPEPTSARALDVLSPYRDDPERMRQIIDAAPVLTGPALTAAINRARLTDVDGLHAEFDAAIAALDTGPTWVMPATVDGAVQRIVWSLKAEARLRRAFARWMVAVWEQNPDEGHPISEETQRNLSIWAWSAIKGRDGDPDVLRLMALLHRADVIDAFTEWRDAQREWPDEPLADARYGLALAEAVVE